MTLNDPVTRLPTVRGTTAAALSRLGIRTLRQLLFHFPSRYEDRRVIVPITQLSAGVPAVIHGTIRSIDTEAGFRRRGGGRAHRMLITRALIDDDAGSVAATWFHQQYLDRQYPPGTRVALAGATTLGPEGLAFIAPEIERLIDGKEPVHTGRLVAIYPETAGVTSRGLRFLLSRVLPLAAELKEYLPEPTRAAENLLSIQDAVRMVHVPASEAERDRARERLGFDELFLLQLAALVRRRARSNETAPSLSMERLSTEGAHQSLPFSLTPSQEQSVKAILDDLRQPVPMNRLLAGDVGSGKTIVAGLAALAVARAGGQTALIAPTEILAIQHADSLAAMFPDSELRLGLLTGSTEPHERSRLLSELRGGALTVLVGTHALFHERVQFKNLGLIIVDEQHRFGVDQRAELTARGQEKTTPHFLSLTATPIPRTLQLTGYGDVDVSLLDPRPGQQVIETHVVPGQDRQQTYDALADRMRRGEQVFVICPRVEEREDDVRSVMSETRRLRTEIFPSFCVGVLHGKLSPEEKRDTLERFRNRDLDLLVSSSVVEVGVDIPNATALLIEGADRFGLAQLHQFRGRVGRRGQAAVCYLLSSDDTPEAMERLRILERSSRGLEIAEEDLQRRGAGDIYGTRQSGGVRLRVARLTDLAFVERVRQAARTLLERDPTLQSAPLLAQRVEQLNVTTHFE